MYLGSNASKDQQKPTTASSLGEGGWGRGGGRGREGVVEEEEEEDDAG